MTDSSSTNNASSKPVNRWDYPPKAYEDYAKTAAISDGLLEEAFSSAVINSSARIINDVAQLTDFQKIFGVKPSGIIKYEALSQETQLFVASLNANPFVSIDNIKSLIDVIVNFTKDMPDGSEDKIKATKIIEVMKTLKNIFSDQAMALGAKASLQKG
jgi:hypothetical protein